MSDDKGNFKDKFKGLFRTNHQNSPVKKEEEEPFSDSTPPVKTKLPKLDNIVTYTLPCLMNESMSFDRDGVLLEQWDGRNFYRLKIQKNTYDIQWQKARPEGVRYFSDKYISTHGLIIVREGMSSPTQIFDAGLELKDTFGGTCGTLCGVFSPDRLLYLRDQRLGVYNIKTHNRRQTLSQTVQGGISVCQHAETGWLAIIDGWGRRLDVYKTDLSYDKSLVLPYQPRWRNGIAAIKDYLVVPQCILGQVNLYNWALDHLGCVEVGSQIYGVGGRDKLQVQISCNEQTILKVYELK